ncbi:VWA domain-containing protein [Engelhardtia mirabilis]|uniref:von Willebrand factor type A domain protein n=1 Tax=Engelhardtia mirabilis TaxID=2528011 RepID=A0A518BLY5_9BACT|nr:von Willebrand factor type A domain protein [Planctomycetes bacterium Pla133]QDV02310.1 von Willebrand factor type A domain protein [Planctomycetes bacterium Pla86]
MPRGAALGGGEVQVGTIDLLVYFAYAVPVEDDWPAEFAAWEPVFEAFSVRLFDATQRQLQLGTVTFTDRDELKASADVWITAGDAASGSHLNGLGVPGRHITISQVHRGTSGAVLGQFALVHESGHYLFGLYDEHRGQIGTDPTTVAHPLHFCFEPSGVGSGSIMDGGSGLAPSNLRTEFCTDLEHNAGLADALGSPVLTAQAAQLGTSCWARMVSSGVGALVAPLETPTSDVAGHQPVAFASEVGELAVVLVLDRSGSMGGEALAQTKLGAKLAVGLLPKGADLGLVSFNGSVTIDLGIGPADATHKGAAIAAIDGLAAGGNTAIGSALTQASGELGLVNGCAELVVLLTDGANNAGPPRISSTVLDPLVAAGTTVVTIALGSDFNPGDLVVLAQATGGRFIAAQSPDQLPGIFTEIFGQASGAVVVAASNREPISAGATEVVPIEVGAGATALRVSLGSDAGASLGLTLVGPGGSPTIDALAPSPGPGVELFVTAVQQLVTVDGPAPGTWTARVHSVAAGTEVFDLSGFVCAPDLSVGATSAAEQVTWPAAIPIKASLASGFPVAGAKVTARVLRPDGSLVPQTLVLRDDGVTSLGDDVAGDGIYGALFQGYQGLESDSGSYTFELEVDGSGAIAAGAGEAGGGVPPVVDLPRARATVSANVQGATSTFLPGNLELVDVGVVVDGQVLEGSPIHQTPVIGFELVAGGDEPVDLGALDLGLASDGGLAALVEFALHLDTDRDGQPDNPAKPLLVVGAGEAADGLRFERADGAAILQLGSGQAPWLLVTVGEIDLPTADLAMPDAGAAGFLIGAGPPRQPSVPTPLVALVVAVGALTLAWQGRRPAAGEGAARRGRRAAPAAFAAALLGASAAIAASCGSGGGGGVATQPPKAATSFTISLEPQGVEATGALVGQALAVGGAPISVTSDL